MSLDQDLKRTDNVKDFAIAEEYDLSISDDPAVAVPDDPANSSLDLLKQCQAKEQTRLLQTFKLLRQRQQQQQQMLMQQQQNQLKAWRDEESKVQLLIATQQGTQWNKALKPNAGDQKSAVLTPPSRPHPLAVNNTQKEFMHVNQSHGAGVSIDSGLAASMQDTLKSQSSLPKPVMYIDPSKCLNPNDEDKYTNSELFSNPGSHEDQFDILRGDDSDAAPDWMSDNSDNFVPPKLPPPRPIRRGRNGGVNDQLAGFEQLLNTAPPGLLQQVLNMLPAKTRVQVPPSYTDEIELSASPTLPKPGQQSRARKLQFHEPSSVTSVQSSALATVSLSQLQEQYQYYLQRDSQQRHTANLFELEQDLQYIPRAVTLTDDGVNSSDLPSRADVDNDNNNDDSEDEDEEDDSYDNQNVTAKEIQNMSLDERPIHGIAGKNNFEQLLEEHLKEEEEQITNQKVADKPHKRPFLKKGEGISRFNSAPKKQQKKLSKKPDRKPSVVHVNGLSRDAARAKQDAEGGQVSDGVHGNKKFPVNFGIKNIKKSAINAKVMERKIKTTTKTSSSSHETTSDKSVANKKLEDHSSQQKESTGKKVEQPDVPNNGNLGRPDCSPPGYSRKSRSDDRDSVSSELDSLAEFELLEDAVDNISFRSNSSLVQKFLVNSKQEQKEVLNKLKIITETKKAAAASGLFWTSKERDHNGFVKDDVIAVSVNHNLNGIQNSNNNSNVHDAEKGQESSDTTLTDSSEEDNDCGRSGQFRNSEGSSQNVAIGDGISASNVDVLQSPSKVMPRKVAPLASKFAAANDTLSMLKSLSLQAGFLTAGHVPVSFRTASSSTSKQGFVSSSVSSSTSDIHGFQASENHHNIQTNYPLVSSNFSEMNTLPKDFKLKPTPILNGDFAQASSAFNQKNWLESKPPKSSMSSIQVSADNASQFNSHGINSDAKNIEESPQKKSYDSHHYELSSDKDSDESDNSDDSQDDTDNVDQRKFASEEDDTNAGGSFGDRKVKQSVESQNTVASSAFFDDEKSWIDEDVNDDSQDSEGETCRKASTTTANNSSTPPTSKLMSKLFPKLKPKPSIETEKAKQALQQASAQPVQTSNGIQSHMLREKLMELDKEIERFRSENANLEMLRREREEGLTRLKQEIEHFQREKEDELKRLEEFKTEEMKKIKRERKLFDSYQKKIRAMPDKREREEIDTLRTQLQELQDELKRKESRWNASTARLKDKLSELELENGELREEIRIMEKRRLEWMTAQSNVKASVQNNGRVSGESSVGKSSGASRQGPTHVLSSTPTEKMEKVKDLSGSRDNFSAAGTNTASLRPTIPNLTTTSTVNKNGRSSIGSYNAQGSSVSLVHNGAVVSSSKIPALKQQVVHTNLSGEGIQNNPVPVMMENNLPVAAEVSSMPGSLASSINSSGKSAARAAMEQAVIDKGDVSSYTEVKHQDGKVEKTYKTGAKEIHFPNGTVKEISADGQTIVCKLANRDIRQIFPDHRVVYIFAEAEIMQTTFPDGLETFQFKNGQIENRYPDGTVEIKFPSKDVKYLFPDGGQEVLLTDGTVMQYNSKGEKIVEYPSGDREVHTAEYQRREFPDGIVKTVYSDGRHETRFPNGRIRLKDKAGNVIMDQIVYR